MRRVLILSADIGEGHATAAASLATALRSRGVEVDVVEDLISLGRLQRLVLRDGSRVLFRWAPRLFGLYYDSLRRLRPARSFAASSLKRFGKRPLLRIVRRHQPDAVISTYPGTTVVLAELRRRGKVNVPAIATVTDLAGLFFWAAPGIDLHLVNWPASLEEVAEVAPDSPVHAVAPLTSRQFFGECCPMEARRSLGLPLDGRVVVVSGGGWGVGNLESAARAAASLEDTTVVCVAGRNERVRASLEEAFADRPDVRVLGFTDRMSDLLAAADALVHGTGGVTCMEAALRGCPVVLFGFTVGHIRHNAEVMERLGLVRRAADERELVAELRSALAGPTPPSPFSTAEAADLVLDARTIPTPRPVTPVRRRVATAMAGVVPAMALLSTGPGYSLAARSLDLAPMHHVSTKAPVVALVIDAPPSADSSLAAALRRRRAGASLAVDPAAHAPVSPSELGRNCDLLPELPPGQFTRWVKTGSIMHRERVELRLAGHARYLVPTRHFTLGQYLLAYRQGGLPVAPAVRVTDAKQLTTATIHPGDVVELAPSSSTTTARQLGAVLSALHARGLRTVSVSELTGRLRAR